MRKSIYAALIASAVLAGCGASEAPAAKTAETTKAQEAATEAATEAAKTTEAESEAATTAATEDTAFDFTKDPIDLKIGVVGSVYDELWAPAAAKLKDEGINLEIVQFTDYVTPNNALANGEIDLNAFQHQIYLAKEVEQYDYKIQAIGNTFIIPLNVYSDKIKSIDELKDGDTIAVPNDLTNEGRALKVLAAAGVITLKNNDNFNPTLDDIEENSKNITIEELAANTIPSTLPDVTAAVVNGNYALDFGLKTEDAVYKDSVLDEEKYWNLIAAKTEDLSDPKLVAAYDAVVKAFQSDETKKVFDETYGGYFINVGWDQDLLADYK
ncbi:metal ABC transporter substrate-binding protein [Oribacterium sp. C9]|uniref:MetQ/NlpA family ABC transporter substrate-binding protein n=1 Tax=Oribacterium sp. C9 TaxID=1943579 RepID=UPI00098FE79E|nr:MetQ/NlpA family ABC transporter substrate-binding protein [Oribacterium sp. C9]OON85192.1 metal ABC transporter substrate-binding protein [Oribacterium sp. C9]